jgi:hypothetical protein
LSIENEFYQVKFEYNDDDSLYYISQVFNKLDHVEFSVQHQVLQAIPPLSLSLSLPLPSPSPLLLPLPFIYLKQVLNYTGMMDDPYKFRPAGTPPQYRVGNTQVYYAPGPLVQELALVYDAVFLFLILIFFGKRKK